MATDVDLVNLALAELQRDGVDNLDTNGASDPVTRLMARLWEHAWHETLQSAPWVDATDLFTLSADGDASPVHSYKYQFALPATILRVWAVAGTSDDTWIRHRRFIRTDLAGPLDVWAITKIDVGEASPLLVGAAAKRLAWRAAKGVGESDATRRRLLGEWRDALVDALGATATERSAQHGRASNIMDAAGLDREFGRPQTAKERSQ